PYKYNSFPVNAGNQIYKLTKELGRSLLSAKERGKLGEMPQVVVFQSLVDATVQTPEVVKGLLVNLPTKGNELLVFDVNRQDPLQGLLPPQPLEGLQRLRSMPSLPFKLTVISNSGQNTSTVAAFARPEGSASETVSELGLQWPRGVVSLGHVALP